MPAMTSHLKNSCACPQEENSMSAERKASLIANRQTRAFPLSPPAVSCTRAKLHLKAWTYSSSVLIFCNVAT
eukprot:1147817-Pelagomonas_calceolata.AAC.2